MKNNTFFIECRDILLAYNQQAIRRDWYSAVIVVPLVEICYAGRLFSSAADKTGLWLDLNRDSITCTVTDFQSQEPMLIEVDYGAIGSWAVCKDGTI